MKFTAVATLVAGTLALAATATAFAQDVTVETEEDKVSYGVGMMMGEQLKQFGDIDYDLLIAGLRAQKEGEETALSIEDAQAAIMAQQQEAAEASQAEAAAASEGYLSENAAREEVSVTDSGLQYEVLEEGDGPKPSVDDTVRVHYVGTLLDGTEFDSSIARGEPAEFPLKGVIPGWTEGVQLMNVGSKYRFVIPSDLAYGERGAGQAIGPNETLVFEVELLEIVGEG